MPTLEEAKLVFFEYVTILTEDVSAFCFSILLKGGTSSSLTFNPPTSDITESIVMVLFKLPSIVQGILIQIKLTRNVTVY